MTRIWRQRKREIRPSDLRAEGVVEIGAAPGTSVLYVRTIGKLYLFHPSYLRDRALDAYAVELAVRWLEDGISGAQVAGNLGVDQATVQRALSDAGYERLNRSPSERRGHDRVSQRLGNRRGSHIVRRAVASTVP